MIDNLIKKYKNKELTVSILGLGYVGLPLSLLFAKKNIKTIGIDIDQTKIEALAKGESYINHINNKPIKKYIDSNFSFLVQILS